MADPITPVIADHIAEGLERAAAGDHAAYVIELDTPGGLVTAMRDIVEDILASPVPVIVYVSPDGARAGSAGALISLAAHVLVMAPGTTIGAATPVGLEGEEVPPKIVNDAASQAEALATLRDRDAGFAVDMVREGRSASVDEALRLGVADARAAGLAEALEASNGREVTLVGQRKATVETAGATVVRRDLGFLRQVLQKLADPNVAFLLLTLGTLGLIYELATPGVGGGGDRRDRTVAGPVQPVGAAGQRRGSAAPAGGRRAVHRRGSSCRGLQDSPSGALLSSCWRGCSSSTTRRASRWTSPRSSLAIVMFGAAVLAGRVAYRARHQPSTTTGADVFTGRLVQVVDGSGQTARAFTEGAWWSVRSIGSPPAAGATARVVGIDGLVLLVDPKDSGAEGEAPPPHRAPRHTRRRRGRREHRRTDRDHPRHRRGGSAAHRGGPRPARVRAGRHPAARPHPAAQGAGADTHHPGDRPAHPCEPPDSDLRHPAAGHHHQDNVTVRVNAVAYFNVVEAIKSVLSIDDYRFGTQQIAQTTLRSVLGQTTLDDLLTKRDR